jgi:hypothetical protein
MAICYQNDPGIFSVKAFSKRQYIIQKGGEIFFVRVIFLAGIIRYFRGYHEEKRKGDYENQL